MSVTPQHLGGMREQCGVFPECKKEQKRCHGVTSYVNRRSPVGQYPDPRLYDGRRHDRLGVSARISIHRHFPGALLGGLLVTGGEDLMEMVSRLKTLLKEPRPVRSGM